MVIIFKLPCIVIFLVAFPAVHGCGQLPTGGERTISFTLSGFKIPAVMAYTDNLVARSTFPAISSTKSEAETFVRRIIKGSVEDVLYQQGRNALLSDDVILSILQQLDIQIMYEPLKCQNAISPMGLADVGMMMNCVVVDGTVTSLCMGQLAAACSTANMVATNLKSIPPEHFSLSGILKTSNIIMANWSNQMWENVLNRVLQKIISGVNGSQFGGASVNIR